eukprot:13553771-Heterocapsa_arctica.AAC.1
MEQASAQCADQALLDIGPAVPSGRLPGQRPKEEFGRGGCTRGRPTEGQQLPAARVARQRSARSLAKYEQVCCRKFFPPRAGGEQPRDGADYPRSAGSENSCGAAAQGL